MTVLLGFWVGLRERELHRTVLLGFWVGLRRERDLAVLLGFWVGVKREGLGCIIGILGWVKERDT